MPTPHDHMVSGIYWGLLAMLCQPNPQRGLETDASQGAVNCVYVPDP